MSDYGRPLTTDEAADAQSLEDILRRLTLDQFPSFPSMVGHISRHFVNLHPDERRYILAGLRGLIQADRTLAFLESLSPTDVTPDAESRKNIFLNMYAKLSNTDSDFLPLYFDCERWYSGGRRRKCSPLENLHYYMKFMLMLKEVISTAPESLDLMETQCSGEEILLDIDHRVRDVSRFVISIYGLNRYTKSTTTCEIFRIRNVHLAFSIAKEARTVLSADEFIEFECVLKYLTEIINENGYRYEKNMSSEALRRLSVIAEPHEKLMQLLMDIPWYHLEESD